MILKKYLRALEPPCFKGLFSNYLKIKAFINGFCSKIESFFKKIFAVRKNFINIAIVYDKHTLLNFTQIADTHYYYLNDETKVNRICNSRSCIRIFC